MKNIVLILSIFVLSIFLVGSAYLLKNESLCCKYDFCKQLTTICIEDEEKDSTDNGEVLSEKGEKLVLENIKDGDTVDVGFEVKGTVGGSWYFESIFPVRVLNKDGEIVESLSALATNEVSDEGSVPFSLQLNVNIQSEDTYILRFEKSNPSGLDENSDFAEISITLKPEEKVETMNVKVFFSSSKLNPELIDCSLVFPVQREIEKTAAVGRAALNELFKGTTEQEEDAGYFTNINEGVEIQSLSIKNKVAYVDLNSKLQEGVGGSCKVSAIRSQITETLKQFSTVDSVVISIDGQSEDILQP